MNKEKTAILLLVFFLFFTLCPMMVAAEETTESKTKDMPTEEITITAHRVIQTLIEQTGSAISVITRRDIDKSKKRLVTDYLQEIPGLNVSRSGPPGQMTTASIRGARSEHTLVLIDGVRVNNPNDPSGGFNFAALPVDNIERIEVVRGPQSTIYGSQAMGGVINIITKTGKPLEPDQEARYNIDGIIEAGGYQSARFSTNVTGSAPKVGFAVGASGNRGGVLSAIAPRQNPHPDADPFGNFTVNGNLDLKPDNRTRVGIQFKNIHDTANLDSAGTIFTPDNPLYWTQRKQNIFNSYFGYDLIENFWNSKLTYSVFNNENNTFNEPYVAPGYDTVNSGRRSTFAWDNTVKAGEHTVLAGFIHDRENAHLTNYEFDPMTFMLVPVASPNFSSTINSFYAQDNFQLGENFYASAGLRHDRHNLFGGHTTYRLTGNYHFADNFLARGSYGTGFKAPTLYQLYSTYGNTTLLPETSRGWDLGAEYRSSDRRHRAGINYFSNRYRNMIEFVSVPLPPFGVYENIGRARSNGWELYGSTRVHPRLQFNGNYTIVNAVDEITNENLIRRPNKLFLGATYDVVPRKLLLSADIVNVGARDDFAFDPITYASTRVRMSAYTLFNATASYRFNPNFETYLRFENMFNTRYEDVWGYNQRGRTVFAGLRFNF
jgi:vitamin B12 transporter